MPDRPKDEGASRSLFHALIREPLFHFFVLGGLIFGAYGWLGPQTAPDSQQRDTIVVTPGRLQQLVHVFQRTWKWRPNADEFRRLIESYVQEEIYYREAVKRGLDKNDTLVRRRMQQKMRFLSEPSEEDLQPTEAELQAYLQANRTAFRTEPEIAFEHVFVREEAETGVAAERAQKLLAQLRDRPEPTDPPRLGDRTLLNDRYPLTSVSGIARNFGPDFADALTKSPRKEWFGPIRSPFGLHLLRITAFQPGRDPPLSEIRDQVLKKWRAKKREDFIAAEYDRMRARYDVVLPFKPEDLPRKVSQK